MRCSRAMRTDDLPLPLTRAAVRSSTEKRKAIELRAGWQGRSAYGYPPFFRTIRPIACCSASAILLDSLSPRATRLT